MMNEKKILTFQDYRMPAEWHPHAATQLHWPTNRQTWPGNRLQKVEEVYLNIIEILHQYEPLYLFVNDEETKNYVLKLFESRTINLQSFNLQPSTLDIQPLT